MKSNISTSPCLSYLTHVSLIVLTAMVPPCHGFCLLVSDGCVSWLYIPAITSTEHAHIMTIANFPLNMLIFVQSSFTFILIHP